MKIAVASVNQTPFAWVENVDRLIAVLDAARDNGANVVCLPALSLSTAGCGEMFASESFQNTMLGCVFDLLPHTIGLVAAIGLPLPLGEQLFHAVCVIENGQILGFACQSEAESFPKYSSAAPFFDLFQYGKTDPTIKWCGQTYPMGRRVFATSYGNIAVVFDDTALNFFADTVTSDTDEIAAVLLPAAKPFFFGNFADTRGRILDFSRKTGVTTVYCNALGNESGTLIYDGAHLVVCDGKVVAESPRFSFGMATLTMTDTDSPDEESLPPLGPEEEFTQAVALGLVDYLAKSHATGFVVSLSGGVDSAAVATLVRLGVELGISELGVEPFLQRIGRSDLHQKFAQKYGTDSPKLDDWIPPLTHELLCCVYQKAQGSSQTTFHAAEELAHELGAEWIHWDVSPIVEEYTRLVENAIGRTLSWTETESTKASEQVTEKKSDMVSDDIALQNIQARSRGPGVWLLANVKRAILLTTSNRSEIAVGYTTMDGDTCGSLAPIAGVDKPFLQHWLRWMATEGLILRYSDGSRRVLRFPSLATINHLAPTAELCPSHQGQTDEDDLMPYPLLREMERLVIIEKLAPAETARRLWEHPEFSVYEPETLRTWIERFYTLWNRNQWKRHRCAPSFVLDAVSLATEHYHYPILNQTILWR